MGRKIDLTINVTDAVRIGEAAYIAVTVTLPDPADIPEQPVVAFAKPGGGYSRGYYALQLPGPGYPAAQADWHAAHGWIFVSIDSLGSGESSIHPPEKLGYSIVAAASHAAEQEILLMLANGTLAPDFPAVQQPLTIGIGHSNGGALTVVQQGRFHGYDGVAILGFSAVHSHFAVPPGEVPVLVPWTSRDSLDKAPPPVLNAPAFAAAASGREAGDWWRTLAWGFYYDDVPDEVIEHDFAHFEQYSNPRPGENREIAPWNSAAEAGVMLQSCMTPGIVAPEAAAIRVPVLCAMGERDMVVDPAGEPRAFRSTNSVDIYICPRMGHIHNYASTRVLIWERIERFASWCAIVKAAE